MLQDQHLDLTFIFLPTKAFSNNISKTNFSMEFVRYLTTIAPAGHFSAKASASRQSMPRAEFSGRIDPSSRNLP
jgi:hypothetical protein